MNQFEFDSMSSQSKDRQRASKVKNNGRKKARKAKTHTNDTDDRLLDLETQSDIVAQQLAQDHWTWLNDRQLRSLSEILRFDANFDLDLAWLLFQMSEEWMHRDFSSYCCVIGEVSDW